jgi:hypothetical protein
MEVKMRRSVVKALSCLVPLVLLAACSLFEPSAASPTIAPAAGSYPPDIVIARLATATAGAAIHYTLDGSTPTKNSTLYSDSGIPVNQSMTIRAIATSSSTQNSDALSASYIIADRGNTIRGSVILMGADYPKVAAAVYGPLDTTLFQVLTINADDTTTGLDPSTYLFYHEPVSGNFVLSGLPSGKGFCLDAVLKRAGLTHQGPVAGDLILQPRAWDGVSASDLAAKANTGIKLVATPIMHIASPVDNSVPVNSGNGTGGPISLTSPVHFAWDAVPGATSYKYTVSELTSGWILVRNIADGVKISATSVDVAVSPLAPDHFYNFFVAALNENYVGATVAEWYGGLLAYDVYSNSTTETWPKYSIRFTVP